MTVAASRTFTQLGTLDRAGDGRLEPVRAAAGRIAPALFERVLAATILSRSGVMHQLLTDLQTLGGNMDWLGPGLAASGPEWLDLGSRLATGIAVTTRSFNKGIQPDLFLQPDGAVPFLHDLTAYMEKIGPRTAGQLPALRPLFQAARDSVAQIDLSGLLTQALSTIGPNDTVRLQINVK